MIAWQKGVQACILACCVAVLPFGASAQKRKPKKVSPSLAVTRPSEVAFQYGLQVGKTYRYRLLGAFNGHIPPFAQPNSPPIHIRVELEYGAQVQKQSEKGTEVAFNVEKADLYLLEKEPDENGKPPKGSEELLFPIPLQQVQDALNVTATLSPTGQVIAVNGGDANSVKVNFGFELRKLFMLMLPIAFPQKPVKLNAPWSFEDGLLGKNAGKTDYVAILKGLTGTSALIDLKSTSKVEEALNKDQKPAKDASDTVETVTGSASLIGQVNFAGATVANKLTGRLKTARLKLAIDVTRKRIVPDPSKPEEPLENRIDVLANLKIEALDTKTTPKTPEKPKP